MSPNETDDSLDLTPDIAFFLIFVWLTTNGGAIR
jgi:hypothetical protein